MTESITGTTTFLFTDVEGSTTLLKSLRERYGEVLAEQQNLLRDAVVANNGVEVDTQGDACFFAFPTATDGVRAALEAQRALAAYEWPDGAPVRVRMGLHSGRASRQDGRYHGVAVHRAARISSAAHGGQILLSQTTRELLEDEEEVGLVTVRDLGVHRLKDLDRPARLFQAVAPGLRRDFPAPRTGLAAERRRRRQLLAAATIVLLAAAGAGAYLLLHEDAPPQLAANTVVRIDPKTNEIADVIPVGRGPAGVTVSGDAAWVVNRDDKTIWRVEPDGDVTARVGSVASPGAIVPDDHGGVWVVGSEGEGEDSTLFHLNRAGVRVATHDVHDPGIWAVSSGGGFVWLTSIFEARFPPVDYLLRFDPASGHVKHFRLGGQNLPAAIAVTPDGIWMPNYRTGSLTRFDPDNGRVEHYDLHAAGSTPSSIAGAGGSIWVGDEGVAEVRRFDSYSGKEQDIITINAPGQGGAPELGVIVAAADEDGAWVYAPQRHSVFRIDENGSVAATISTGRWEPQGLAASSEGVWVTIARPPDE